MFQLWTLASVKYFPNVFMDYHVTHFISNADCMPNLLHAMGFIFDGFILLSKLFWWMTNALVKLFDRDKQFLMQLNL